MAVIIALETGEELMQLLLDAGQRRPYLAPQQGDDDEQQQPKNVLEDFHFISPPGVDKCVGIGYTNCKKGFSPHG